MTAQAIDWNAALQPFVEWANGVREALQPALDHVQQVARDLHDALQRDYARAGMPYGDSDEGMYRWFDEVMLEGRIRAEAEAVEERNQFIGDFRQQVQENRS
jgi:hypothetical protein